MIRQGRMSATLDGEFVVFLIGMRINRPWLVHKWLPVAKAMPRMLIELYRQPELGFLHGETWFSRTIIMLQYWRSIEQLMAYSNKRNAEHLPAWKAFNRSIGASGTVGLWHETYLARAGSYENIYVNMPAFGLGKVGTIHDLAQGGRQTLAARLRAKSDEPA